MRLLHYSPAPIEAVYSCKQAEEAPRHRFDKPNGLWVSVEGEHDWLSWCEAESYGSPREQLCYEVVLSERANILRIESAEELRGFTRKYGVDPYIGTQFQGTLGKGINWDAIATEYDGIIIAPYRWECRLAPDTGWYYGWDCASGCIWDAEAVGRITLVQQPASECAA